jgi:hypothetical protein
MNFLDKLGRADEVIINPNVNVFLIALNGLLIGILVVRLSKDLILNFIITIYKLCRTKIQKAQF